MKSSFAAFAAFLGLVSAQNAVVVNNCPGTIYAQSFPYDGSASGPLTALERGQTFSEPIRASGSTIKLAKSELVEDAPLFFGYSTTTKPSFVYYEFSSEWGNPFIGDNNVLFSNKICKAFDCKANETACYSTPAHKQVHSCRQPANITAVLCH